MESDAEKAERLSRGRAVAWPFLGLAVLVAHQGVFFAWNWDNVGILPMVIWTVLAIGMVALTLTGGRRLLPKRLRAFAEDEVTRANRDTAIRMGFLAGLIMSIIVFVVAPFEPLPAQRAAHLIFSMSLGISFLVFGLRELFSLG
ncbi:MAG: hypothetical protein ABS75_13710 [Pelagibacterium sp. SCN 63-23]|jgi:hypothetical protein|nr:MAG: hypothetical protein ABS75_13710 [Pelagibacterium sp. SCN 63-23]